MEVGKLEELGGGYQGYEITSPKGKTFVAEATSGGLVGDTLREVRSDIQASIREGRSDVMAQQVADAIREAKTAQTLSVEDFWNMLKA